MGADIYLFNDIKSYIAMSLFRYIYGLKMNSLM